MEMFLAGRSWRLLLKADLNLGLNPTPLSSHHKLSLTELLKAEVVKSHGCAKFSRIFAKFGLLSAKLVKQALFLCFDAT